MRFFHISDLHIGKQLYHYSLKEAQSAILEQIVARVQEYGPDALLIAGDIFDKSAPSGEAYMLFDAFLDQLAEVKPQVPVFLIAGNHDSGERLQYAASFLEKHQIHIAAFPPGEEGERLKKVTLTDPFGLVDIYLLPFTKPSYVRHLFPEGKAVSYDEAVGAVLEREELDLTRRNVLLSHQFYVSGSERPMVCASEQGYLTHGGGQMAGAFSGRGDAAESVREAGQRSEGGQMAGAFSGRGDAAESVREAEQLPERKPLPEERRAGQEGVLLPVSVGGIDSVDVSRVRQFDYVALGHLHGAQWIGRPQVRYCGTPLKYSVSEEKQEKSITLVTLEEKGSEVKVETIPLTARQDVRTERGTLEEVIGRARRGTGKDAAVYIGEDPAAGQAKMHVDEETAIGQAEVCIGEVAPDRQAEVCIGEMAPDGQAAGEGAWGPADDFVSITLTDEKELFHPRERLEEHYSHILEVRMDNSRTRAKLSAGAEGPVTLEPMALFRRFYQEMQGAPMSREEAQILRGGIGKGGEGGG